MNILKDKFAKSIFMALLVEDLDDQSKFRQLLSVSYGDLIPFILGYLKKRSALTGFYWSFCILFLAAAVRIRFNISNIPIRNIIFHTSLGLIILPVFCIPVHELLHIIPYVITGAKKIRVGMDLKQYLFYVTAHRYVSGPLQFRIVAFSPFILISITSIVLILNLPALWKWSLSLFLFVHTTMCAGDIALLNFYFVNKGKKIYSWDDADKKMAYFYEEIGQE